MTTMAITAPGVSGLCRHAEPSGSRGGHGYRTHLRDSSVETSTGWRLTHRGRVLIVALMLLLISTAVVVGAFRATAASTTPPAGWAPAVVQPGDTLWSLAASASNASEDPRAVIATIKTVNGLTGSSLVPGQRLYLPR